MVSRASPPGVGRVRDERAKMAEAGAAGHRDTPSVHRVADLHPAHTARSERGPGECLHCLGGQPLAHRVRAEPAADLQGVAPGQHDEHRHDESSHRSDGRPRGAIATPLACREGSGHRACYCTSSVRRAPPEPSVAAPRNARECRTANVDGTRARIPEASTSTGVGSPLAQGGAQERRMAPSSDALGNRRHDAEATGERPDGARPRRA